jgi:hypothetical protein
MDAARRRVATQARLSADVAALAGRVLAVCGPPVRGTRASQEELIDALAGAAGVPIVVEAVRAERDRSARRATGWPPTRWLSRFRPDPLRRLHLGRRDAGRTSLPPPGPAQLARARGAVRGYLDLATSGAPVGWVLAARRRADVPPDVLADALDQAVAGTPVVPARDPRWWRAIGVVQWLLLAAGAGGALWLGGLAGAAYLRLPQPDPPSWGEAPIPTIALVGGVGLGILLALVARQAGSVGARRQARYATARLRAAVAEVAHTFVVGPVDEVMAALVTTRDAAQQAAGGRRGRRGDR